MTNKVVTLRLDWEGVLAVENLKNVLNEKTASKAIISAIKEFGLARNEAIRPDIADEIKSLIREEFASLRSEFRDTGFTREVQPGQDVAEDNEPVEEPDMTRAPVEINAPAEEPAMITDKEKIEIGSKEFLKRLNELNRNERRKARKNKS